MMLSDQVEYILIYFCYQYLTRIYTGINLKGILLLVQLYVLDVVIFTYLLRFQTLRGIGNVTNIFELTFAAPN